MKNKIKHTQIIALFAFLLISLTQSLIAQTPKENIQDAIIGTWLMPDDEGIIEICKENELYKGKILWIKEREEDGSPLKDKENPVDSLQSRNVEGLKVMKGFKYEGDNLWSGGTFYAARKGKTVEPDFVLVDNNHLNIEISILIFSMTVELTRVDTAQFFEQLKIKEK